jgi:hypothetical protein
MASPDTYASEDQGVWYNTYTGFSMGMTISVILLLIENTVSVLLWCLTATNVQWLINWYLDWCGLMHYVDAFRFMWLIVTRTLGMWMDHPTSYKSFSGLQHTKEVSKKHVLEFWDIMMEFAHLTMTLGFYPDLKSIKNIKPKKAGDSTPIDADDDVDETLEI